MLPHEFVGEVDLPEHLEPLLNKAEQRFVLYPIQYPEIWDMYKSAESTFWITEQIQLEQDDIQWNNHLNDGERSFVSRIIIFFLVLHGIHIPNLLKRLSIEIHIAEARCFYGFESVIENVHSEVYCVLINTFIKNSKDRELLFDTVEDIPPLQENTQWALQWISDDHSTFAICLVIFATMKTIACSASFAILIWLRKRQLLPALNASNELVRRDLQLHARFACLLFHHLRRRPHPLIIKEIIHEAVQIQHRLLCDAIPLSLIGINPDSMKEYIRFIADDLLLSLGNNKLYDAVNPFKSIPLSLHPKPLGVHHKEILPSSLPIQIT
ncbi:ribonucleotide reductase small subunit [Pisolithus tinctorius]|nr:ribonucleotide reductase small subunit [Pisolithus tinctorius]